MDDDYCGRIEFLASTRTPLHRTIIIAESASAPNNDTRGHLERRLENPFASPASLPSNFPKLPEPCARPMQNYPPRSSRAAMVAGDLNTNHDQSQQHSTYGQPKAGSMSSTAESAMMTPMSSIDLEKAGLAKEQEAKRSSRESKRSKRSRSSKDPEKAVGGGRHDSHHPNNPTSITDDEDDDEFDEGRCVQEEKAVKILLFMSCPCVILSAMNTAWACIALVITALAQPIRLCSRRPSFGQQLAGLLGPTLNLQLRCIYTPLPPHANEDGSYHTFMLVAVHILSPFLSFVMMFAAWTLAVYWLCSGVVGDPAGQDKRDDGKETVLGLRNWWETWLIRSIKDE